MKIARRISTQEWINDFQQSATAEVLVANAVAAGIPANDIEVLDLPKAEWDAAVESVVAPLRAAVEQQAALTKTQMVNILNQVRQVWGLTVPQMKLFVRAMKQLNDTDL